MDKGLMDAKTAAQKAKVFHEARLKEETPELEFKRITVEIKHAVFLGNHHVLVRINHDDNVEKLIKEFGYKIDELDDGSKMIMWPF